MVKYFLLIVLCAGLAGGPTFVTAQSRDSVLATKGGRSLKQSDVDNMIAFYEWAFEAEFSGEQKAKFAELTASEFRTDPVKYRATIDDIAGSFAKISAADAASQRKARKDLLDAFLPEIRKGTDENSQMLLAIYESAHGGNGPVAETSGDQDATETLGGNISAIAGTWVWGRSGSSTYSTGGSYLGGNGSRHSYKFLANGMVEYTGIMNVMTGGCNMQVFKSAKGTASLSGSTLTIRWSPAAFSRDDSCDRAGNYKKTLPAETETFQVKFKTDYGQRQLCMTQKSETCFSPSN